MTTQSAEKRQKNGISLLSLDAGGPRGISQLEILKHVMDRLTRESGCDSSQNIKRPCDVFAMIGGTGTGGLISVLLAVLEMTVDEALESFTSLVNKALKDADGDPIGQTDKLKQAINDILGKYRVGPDTKLASPGPRPPACKLILPVLDTNNTGSPIILTNYVDRQGPPTNLTVAEAMLATCASTPFFSPAKVVKEFSTVEYIAADLGLSNPIREIIDGAHRAFGGEMPVISLLSIGCGNPGVNAVPDDSYTISRVVFLERITMDSERTAQNIASQMGKLTLYHRLSVAYGMEATRYQSQKEPEVIAAQTRSYLEDEEVATAMNRCISTLRDGAGFTTLEYLKFSGGEKVLAPELLELTPNYVQRKIPTEFLEKCILNEQGDIKKGSKRIIVTGMGGCGKTQLVRKFIEHHSDLFATAFFVDGSSEETIKRDLVQHVRSLGGAHSQKSFKEAKQFLSLPTQERERLLVIDNADDPEVMISPLLPRWKRGTIIITSRNASHGQLGLSSHLKLDVMEKDESIELLNLGSGGTLFSDQDRESAGAVAEELGFLPIALVQAASYINRTRCSAEAYISLLRTSRERILSDPATNQIDMRYTTAFAAFDASYSILPSNSKKTLHLLSFMHRQKLPVQSIAFDAENEFSFEDYYLDSGNAYKRGKECLKEIFYSQGKWEPAEVDSIIASLRNHSFVTVIRTEATRLLQMHSLVHEWARLRVPIKNVGWFQDGAVRLLSCNAQHTNYWVMQYLHAHVQSLSSIWETLHANDIASLSFILAQCGDHSGSLTLREHLGSAVFGRPGVAPRTTVLVAANLAATYDALGQYAKAEQLGVDVLKCRIKLLGVKHPDTILASSNLAHTYCQLGRYSDAEPLQLEVLEQRRKSPGINHPDTIRASTNLAATYGALGRYSEAEKLEYEVLEQSKALLGEEHPDTIRASANLATSYRQLGRYAEAEKLEVKVLEQRINLLGAEHPSTILASSNLAATYSALGRYAETERLEDEVLKQRTKSLGVEHLETIRASANLAVTYGKLGKYAEAEQLEVVVLKQRIELLGANHPDTIRASSNLATTYSQLGRDSEAEPLQLEVLDQRRRLLGDNHPSTILASGNLAATYHALGRYAEAEALQVEVLQKRRELLGDRHPDTIASICWLASTYKMTQRYSEALEFAKRAYDSYVATFGEGHSTAQSAARFIASLENESSVKCG